MQPQSTTPLVYIYLLLDPTTLRPRYVGQTRRPETRLSAHLADRQRSYKVHWLQKLRTDGHAPLFEVIDVVPLERADSEERFWIGALRGIGHKLVNGTSGGGNGFVMSAEARARISAAAKTRPSHKKTPEECAAISARQLGRLRGPLSEAHRAKLSAAGKGRKYGPYPAERVKKVADANRGRPLSEEHRAKLSAALTGMKKPPRSDEWRRKRSLYMAGRKPSPETCAMIAAANTGRTHSEETKMRMSESAKRRSENPEYRARQSESQKRRWQLAKARLAEVPLPPRAMIQLSLGL